MKIFAARPGSSDRRQTFDVPIRQWPPCRQHDFERARDARTIVDRYALRGRGIEPHKLCVKRRRALALQPAADVGSNIGRDRRHSGEPGGQRLEIKAGAADENRYAPLRDDVIECLFDVAAPAADRIILCRINKAIEPVRYALFLCRRWTRCNDAQVAIHLHRIGIDDDATEPLRQLKRQRRLAAGGRPCNKHALDWYRASHDSCRDPDRDRRRGFHTAVETARAALPGAGRAAEARARRSRYSLYRGNHRRPTLACRTLCVRTTSGIDIVVQPAAARRKKLFLADMDSTMIRQECIDELADYVGLKAHVAAITERAMRGDIAFEPALRERVALLEGLPISVIEEVLRDRIRLTPGGKTLVATMRANGAVTCMVSGGFTLFTDRIAAMIGFDKSRANRLTLVDAAQARRQSRRPVFGRDGKRAALIELRQDLRPRKN